MSGATSRVKKLKPFFVGTLLMMAVAVTSTIVFASQQALAASGKDVSRLIRRCSSIAELQSALTTASPGDEIVLADGHYNLANVISISAQGNKDHPISLRAEHKGKVLLTGDGGFSLVSPAAYITIEGFDFKHRSSRAKSGPGTGHCRWTQNVFETTGKGEDLLIAGSDHEIDHNVFQHKNAMGRFLAIRGSGSQIATNLWIHHNQFMDFKDQGGANGAEALQFGLSGYSMSYSHSLVENNQFEGCDGEAELISVKASGVILRYNTFSNSKAQFTLRHGNYNTVYQNKFFNTPGIRFFGDDQKIYRNYFENCPLAIQIGNGDGEVKDGAKLTCHDRPDHDFVGFNTLVNNKKNIVFNGRNQGLGATDIQIVGNTIRGGGPAAHIENTQKDRGLLRDALWSDNIIETPGGPGDMPMAASDSNRVVDLHR